MGFKVNLTNDEVKQAQGGGFSVLPAGIYGAQIFENVQKKSKNSNNEMFETNYKLIQGPAGLNRKIKAWYVLEGKGMFKIVELHKALGGEDEGFAIPSKAGEYEFPDADEYLGKTVNLTIGVEDYNSVATQQDVDFNKTAEAGTEVLNSETGEPVVKVDEPVTKQRNVVKNARPYDEDEITTAEDLENAEEDAPASGFTL